MPNSKISALTSATTPLAGTEVLPIVQSSTTTQVTVANLTAGRAVSGTSFSVTGSTIPTNGIYLPATNSVGISTNGILRSTYDASGNVGFGVTPGAWSSGWKALESGYLGNAFTSNAANSSGITSNAILTGAGWKYGVNGFANFMAVGNNTGQYVWYNAPSGVAGNAITFTQVMGLDTSGNLSITGNYTANSVAVPTISSTSTLTNKRVTPRVSTTTSSATPTINTDSVDVYGLTAQAVDITSFSTNLSGTPTDGQLLRIYIVGTAARAITWGASFEASTTPLPTTTVTTNRLDVGFVWNAATSKWRCLASA
jgi:hypothetical protein